MVISQLDQTRTSVPLSSLSMLDTWKSRSWRPIFGLNVVSRTSCGPTLSCFQMFLNVIVLYIGHFNLHQLPFLSFTCMLVPAFPRIIVIKDVFLLNYFHM